MKTMHILLTLVPIAAATILLQPEASGSATLQTDHQVTRERAAPDTLKEPEYAELPGYGKTCRIGDSLSFTYEFDKRPKMGTAILKIRLFDARGKRVSHLDITGQSDMPSMRGAHDSGAAAFKLNRRGDYLLPINIVMPGVWEVKLVFSNGTEVVYRGRFEFKV
jgi:hypothetical protein